MLLNTHIHFRNVKKIFSSTDILFLVNRFGFLLLLVFFPFPEDLNHWGWLVPLEILSTMMTWAGPATASCSRPYWVRFEYLKEGNSTTSLGNCCLTTLTVNKFFLYLKGISFISISAHDLLSYHCIQKIGAWLQYLYPPIRYLCTLINSPLSLLFLGVKSPRFTAEAASPSSS